MIWCTIKSYRDLLQGNNTCFLGDSFGGQRPVQYARINHLLNVGVSGYSLLVLLPDQATVRLFREEINRPSRP